MTRVLDILEIFLNFHVKIGNTSLNVSMQTTAYSVLFLHPDLVVSESITWDLPIGVLAD